MTEVGKTFMEWATLLFRNYFVFVMFSSIYFTLVFLISIIEIFNSDTNVFKKYSDSFFYIYSHSMLLLCGIIPIFYEPKSMDIE